MSSIMGGGERKKGNMHALRIINNAEYFYTFLVQCQADNFNGEPYSCLHQPFRKEMGQVVTAYSQGSKQGNMFISI